MMHALPALTLTSRPDAARLDLEPLNPGFGHTLGAALCRALQASTAPTLRARYQVGGSRVGRRADFEQLVLSLEGPTHALQTAARRLCDQLRDLVADETDPGRQPPGPAADTPPLIDHPLLLEDIDTLDLSVRASRSLRAVGIDRLRDLIGRSAQDLLRLPHLGRRCLREVEEALAARGLRLGMGSPR